MWRISFVYRKLLFLIMYLPRKVYYAKRKKKLVNTTPTIIASDCFGGFVYHNLGLQFMSPTINLFFTKEDFFAFVKDLRGYLGAELEEVDDDSVKYPVGELSYNGKKIRVNFMHYENFDIAKQKWDSRKNRVDFSNIYITQIIVDATENDIKTFDNLPYENKMLITKENLTNSKNVVTHSVFGKQGYKAGEILGYKSVFSVKRYMDEIDYVGFLNKQN